MLCICLVVAQNIKSAKELLIDTHHGTSVVELSAVVWRREYYELCPITKLIAIFIHLMCSAYEAQVRLFQELGGDLSHKSEGIPSVTHRLVQAAFVGVRPEQVTEHSLIKNICGSHYLANLFLGL